MPARSFAPGLLVVSLLACGTETPIEPTLNSARSLAAIPLTDIQSAPLSFEQFVPCAAGGAGETIEWTGELTLVFHSTTLLDRDGELRRLLAVFSFSGTLTGIGQTTGDVYQVRYSQHGPSHEPDIIDRAAPLSNFVLDLRIRSADGRFLGRERVRAHITTSPSGETKDAEQTFPYRTEASRT